MKRPLGPWGQKCSLWFQKPVVRWAAGYLALQLCMVCLVYYWRVFYGYAGSAIKPKALCYLAAKVLFAGAL